MWGFMHEMRSSRRGQHHTGQDGRHTTGLMMKRQDNIHPKVAKVWRCRMIKIQSILNLQQEPIHAPIRGEMGGRRRNDKTQGPYLDSELILVWLSPTTLSLMLWPMRNFESFNTLTTSRWACQLDRPQDTWWKRWSIRWFHGKLALICVIAPRTLVLTPAAGLPHWQRLSCIENVHLMRREMSTAQDLGSQVHVVKLLSPVVREDWDDCG